MTDLARRRGAALPAQAIGVRAFAGQQAQVTVDNTEKSLLDAVLTIPASGGRFQAGDVLDIEIVWTLVNNSGGARAYTPRLKLGATALAAQVTQAVTAHANTRVCHTRAKVLLTAINVQRAYTELNVGSTAASAPGYAFGYQVLGTAAEDLSASKTLDFTLQSDAATATQAARVDQITVVHHPATA